VTGPTPWTALAPAPARVIPLGRDDTVAGMTATAADALSAPAPLSTRWWDLGAATTAVVVAALAVTSPVGHPVVAATAGVAFVVLWIALARPAVRRDDERVSASDLAVVAGAVLVGGLAVAGAPQLAVLQAFLMPLLWTVLPTPRSAIAANVALCLAVAAGFVVSLGWSTETLVTAVTSEGLSLAFSVALGLWITTIARTGSERGRLLDELRAAQDELAAHHRDAGTVAERERLAREIHDTVAQSLTGLVMLSQQARSALVAGDASTGLARVELIEASARDALTDARTLVAATASAGLDGGDLAVALRRLAERFSRESGVVVTVDVAPGSALPRDQQVVVVRTVQEALANVRKHSDSRSAHVSLGPTGGRGGAPGAPGLPGVPGFVLSVRDEGAGFDPEAPRDGFGLDGLADRLRLAGGRLEVSSGPAGTTVTAHLPGATP